MIRTCNWKDSNWASYVLREIMNQNGLMEPCGMTYDDVDHRVFCPHEKIVGETKVYGPENNWGYMDISSDLWDKFLEEHEERQSKEEGRKHYCSTSDKPACKFITGVKNELTRR